MSDFYRFLFVWFGLFSLFLRASDNGWLKCGSSFPTSHASNRNIALTKTTTNQQRINIQQFVFSSLYWFGQTRQFRFIAWHSAENIIQNIHLHCIDIALCCVRHTISLFAWRRANTRWKNSNNNNQNHTLCVFFSSFVRLFVRHMFVFPFMRAVLIVE